MTNFLTDREFEAGLASARLTFRFSQVVGIMLPVPKAVTWTEASRHDAWQAGDSYDAYMGRWSRVMAPQFLRWLAPREGLDWVEIGCGTGALTAAILAHCKPRSLISIDSSEGFLSKAGQNIGSDRVNFQLGDAQALNLRTASRNIAVSGLVLNFVPDRKAALAEMRRVIRPGATAAFYVWDYPGGGLEFLRAFWSAAVTLDPAAADLKEDRRFPYCTPQGLVDLARSAGLSKVDCASLEIPTMVKDFDDLWHPFTLGAGPAPGFCASLRPDHRLRLKDKLREALPFGQDGSISLKARAWAVRGTNAAAN